MQYRANYTRERISTAPRLSGKPYKAPAKVAEGEFDPDELTRRLYIVLAEQKAHAERKQRARKYGLGRSSSTRHDDSARPGQDAKPRHAEPPADLITQLNRSESAKRKTSHPAPAPDAATAATAEPEAYHHVPKEAAKQFTRTTTVENMRTNSDLVHKLSKRALKFHLDGPLKVVRAGAAGGKSSSSSGPPLSPAQFTHALQQTQSQRAAHLDRNQFQRTRILEEAARLDQQKSPRATTTKHTFQDELAHILPLNNSARRNSTGTDPFPPHYHNPTDDTHLNPYNRRSLLLTPDMLTLDPLFEDTTTTSSGQPLAETLSRFPPPDRARVDWTQSDEPQPHHGNRSNSSAGNHGGGGPKLLLLSPLLRKADSLWTLKGRRGSRDSAGSGSGSASGSGKGGGEKGEGEREGGSEVSSPTARAGKGFFGRFKR